MDLLADVAAIVSCKVATGGRHEWTHQGQGRQKNLLGSFDY